VNKGHGYIIERVVDDIQKHVAYQGTLCIEGLPPCLTPPLTLLCIEVIQVHPTSSSSDLYLKGTVKLNIALLCTVIDCCGKKETGIAWISQELCLKRCAVGNIRYSAQVVLDRAAYCAGVSFEICARLCFHIVVSCSEMIRRKTDDCKCCTIPPLYPHSCVESCAHGRRFF